MTWETFTKEIKIFQISIQGQTLSSLVIDWHFSFLLSTDQENPGSNPWLQDIEPDPPLVWTVHRQVTQLSPLLPTTALFQSLLVPQLVQQVQVNADIQ